MIRLVALYPLHLYDDLGAQSQLRGGRGQHDGIQFQRYEPEGLMVGMDLRGDSGEGSGTPVQGTNRS